MPILLNGQGTPEPPTDIVRRLRRLPAAFEIEWSVPMSCWTLLREWRQDDPRRAKIQTGEIGDYPYDVVCHLPQDINVGEVPAYVERGLRSYNTDDLTTLLDSLAKWNEEQTDRNMAPAVDPILDDIDSIAGRRLLEGSVASFASTPAKGRKKRGR